MSHRIDETAVLKAASEWAERTGRNTETVSSTAQDVMVRLKSKLNASEYQGALKQLHGQYKRDNVS
ncbi:hypothetical protein EGJ53_00255 [Pseudomonas fluorescens]|nr:hypothetical protein EGJ53_00255 [Pseudomonas fluorescens]